MTQTKDLYSWRAVYRDGGYLDEQDAHGFDAVDKPYVQRIELWADNLPVCQIDTPEGATPVFLRRRTLTIHPGESASSEAVTTHCVGWKTDAGGVYLFILPDGRVLLSSNFQAV